MAKPETKKTRKELEDILQEDLLYEILLHLPLKSLIQCKVLSSLWKTRISCRSLTRMRLERHPNPNSTVLLLSRSPELAILPCHNGDKDLICHATLRFERWDTTNYWVVGTQHGLICFSNYITGDALIWNPVLKQWRTLDFQHASYNPSSNTLFGFGYDTINDDYKVVRISNSAKFETSCITIEICELRNTKARVIVMPSLLVQSVLGNVMPITINGSSYWIAFHPRNKNLQIIRFDMDTEKFVEIPFSDDMPNIFNATGKGIVRTIFTERDLERLDIPLEGFDMDGKRFRLGVFRESLCLFITDSLEVDVWLMNRRNRDDSHVVWTKMFELPISRKMEEVYGFTANEELVIRNEDNTYFAYDPQRKRSVFPLAHNFRIRQVVAYVENSVSVSP